MWAGRPVGGEAGGKGACSGCGNEGAEAADDGAVPSGVEGLDGVRVERDECGKGHGWLGFFAFIGFIRRPTRIELWQRWAGRLASSAWKALCILRHSARYFESPLVFPAEVVSSAETWALPSVCVCSSSLRRSSMFFSSSFMYRKNSPAAPVTVPNPAPTAASIGPPAMKPIIPPVCFALKTFLTAPAVLATSFENPAAEKTSASNSFTTGAAIVRTAIMACRAPIDFLEIPSSLVSKLVAYSPRHQTRFP